MKNKSNITFTAWGGLVGWDKSKMEIAFFSVLQFHAENYEYNNVFDRRNQSTEKKHKHCLYTKID